MSDPFVNTIQTRSGLSILRDNNLAAIEVSPWASKSQLMNALYEESKAIIPLYAIRYNWITSGEHRLELGCVLI